MYEKKGRKGTNGNKTEPLLKYRYILTCFAFLRSLISFSGDDCSFIRGKMKHILLSGNLSMVKFCNDKYIKPLRVKAASFNTELFYNTQD